MNYLVLNVREYSFRDDKDKAVEGATITYLDLGNEPEKGEKGFAPLQISANIDQTRDFPSVPGFYDMQFKHKRGAQNKVRVVFHSATLKQAVTFTQNPATPGASSSS
jgi:hypothetical protein